MKDAWIHANNYEECKMLVHMESSVNAYLDFCFLECLIVPLKINQAIVLNIQLIWQRNMRNAMCMFYSAVKIVASLITDD